MVQDKWRLYQINQSFCAFDEVATSIVVQVRELAIKFEKITICMNDKQKI